MRQKTGKIYVDIDDCLASSSEHLCNLINNEFGRNVSVDDISHFDLAKSFGLTDAEHRHLMRCFHEAETITGLPPIPASVEAVSRWERAGHEIWIVTGRHMEAKEPTSEWLQKHRIPFSRIVFADKTGCCPMHKHGDSMALKDLLEIDFEFAIDDSAWMIAQLASRSKTKRCFLMDRPWNRAFADQYPDVTQSIERILSFQEIK